MASPRAFLRGIAILKFLLLLGAVYLLWRYHEPIGAFPGTFLDVGQPPVKADVALVLAGGWTGERVLMGGQLARQGYVPFVLLSGPSLYFERPECDYAIPYAEQHGYERDLFQCAPLTGVNSTRAETQVMADEIRRRGLRKVLLVTSEYHSRRALRMFRDAAADLDVVPVSAPTRAFEIRRWYRSREGWKSIVLEWSKYLSSFFGI